MNNYQCIFCGNTIDKKEKITSLLIAYDWEDEAAQETQQVFCHMRCFVEKCYSPKSIYIGE